VRCARGLVGRGRTLAESGRAQASSGGRHAASAPPQAPSFRTQALVRSSPQVVKTSASVVRSSARVMRRGPSVVRSPPLVVGSSASAKLSTALDERRSPKCLISFGRENEGGDRRNAISRPLRVVIDGDARRSRAPSRSDRERASLSPRRPLDGSRVERGRRCFTAAAPSSALRRSPLR